MTRESLIAELEAQIEERDAIIEAQRTELRIRAEELRVHAEEVRRLLAENDALKARVDQLCRRMFGKSSEKVDPSQLALAFRELESQGARENDREPTSGEETPATRRRARPHGRRRPAQDLERRRVEVHPPEEERTCRGCGSAMRPIGEETSERYEYVPASCFVEVTARVKYACGACAEGVVIASPPPTAIERSVAGPGLVAHVIASKYADHLPLYRQEEILARQGVDLSRSTLKDLVMQAAERLEPIARAVLASILKGRVIQSDDTPVTVLGGETGSETGHLWAYVGEEDEVAYDFTMSRSRDGPLRVLEGFRGFVQADAYSGYDALYRREGVTEVGCWAHARRYFVEALSTDARSARLLALIRQLYAVEEEIRDLEETDRMIARQERARPILQAIRSRLADVALSVLPKSPLGKGVTYATRNWDALVRFTEQGYLEIDNNAAERALRAVALGRKNWLFAGSEEGGRRAAILMTLMGTCRLQGVDPFRYLRDVLVRRWTTPVSRIHDLTPRGWKTAVAQGRITPRA